MDVSGGKHSSFRNVAVVIDAEIFIGTIKRKLWIAFFIAERNGQRRVHILRADGKRHGLTSALSVGEKVLVASKGGGVTLALDVGHWSEG